MMADIAVVMSLLMITSALAVTRSPADTESFRDFLASNFSLIVIGMDIPLLVFDGNTYSLSSPLPSPGRTAPGACVDC
jgi:hypothetical protein